MANVLSCAISDLSLILKAKDSAHKTSKKTVLKNNGESRDTRTNTPLDKSIFALG